MPVPANSSPASVLQQYRHLAVLLSNWSSGGMEHYANRDTQTIAYRIIPTVKIHSQLTIKPLGTLHRYCQSLQSSVLKIRSIKYVLVYKNYILMCYI